MRRYELTDEQYKLIRDLLPVNGKRGGQWNDHRAMLNGMFWILHSGSQWREMPRTLRPMEERLRPVQPLEEGRNDRSNPPAVADEAEQGRNFDEPTLRRLVQALESLEAPRC